MNRDTLQALPAPVVVACAAPTGSGGMGRHLEELTEQLRAARQETTCFDLRQTPKWLAWLKRWTPLRFSAAWQGFLESVVFDAQTATRLPAAKTFIGFNGQCLRSFRAARTKPFEKLILVAATPHVNLTVAQARKAWEYAPVEPLGYIRRQHEQFLLEYELADQILYATNYIRDSFITEKFPEEKLRRFELTPHPRFKPAKERKRDETFRIVSVGSLNLVKGTVVLIDAFAKLEAKNAELTLIGGSGSKQMRAYLDGVMRKDARVRIAPGDPLPHLQAANVCAHAAFQDGFAYAPMEALACGVPVVVTDHTGMKEHVGAGVNGFIVPTGDAEALCQALTRVKEGALPRA